MLSMSINIYSVYNTSRSCDVVCLNGLHNIWSQTFKNKNSLMFKDSTRNHDYLFVILLINYERITILYMEAEKLVPL